MSLKQELQARILDNSNIEWKKSRFSKEEAFYIGTKEIAHFHGENEIDVRITKAEIKKRNWNKSDDPRLKVRSSSSEWVEIQLNNKDDLLLAYEAIETAAQKNKPK